MMGNFHGIESQKLTHREVRVNLEIHLTSRFQICQVVCMCE